MSNKKMDLLSMVAFVCYCANIVEGANISASVLLCSATSLPTICNTVGGVVFTQEINGGPVYITGNIFPLTNVNSTSIGFHVHQYGSVDNICGAAGPHYSTNNNTHGAPWDNIRHVGDLGNVNLTVNQTTTLNFTDSVIQLKGANSIIGRALVLHSAKDDYGKNASSPDSLKTGNAGSRIACGVIGITSNFNVNNNSAVINDTSAKAIIATVNLYSAAGKNTSPSLLVGTVNFTQNNNTDSVKISGNIDNFYPFTEVSSVGFHVHEYGLIYDNCLNIGNHYNPVNVAHGAPWDKPRHVGDLGNVNFTNPPDNSSVINFEDSTIQLKGPYSIVGRALVLHAYTDDYGKNNATLNESLTSGSTGLPVACGVIGLISDTNLADPVPVPVTTVTVTTTKVTVPVTTVAVPATTTAKRNGSSMVCSLIRLKLFCLTWFIHKQLTDRW